MLLFNELKWYLLGAFEKGVMWVLRGGGGMAELHPSSENILDKQKQMPPTKIIFIEEAIRQFLFYFQQN